MRRNRHRVAWWMVIAIAAVGLSMAMVLGGCGGAAPLQPVVCATYLAPDGTWMEEDNEPVDDDPCDRFPDGLKVSTSKAKPPVVKVTPGKSQQKPIGGSGKKF